MIIIIDKTEVSGGMFSSVANIAPLDEIALDLDILNSHQITEELYDQVKLFIITDAENSQFKVFKDNQGVFEVGKVYTTGEIGGWTWLYMSRWLASLKVDDE